ncbi:hypothetical protein V492_04745 [Pseudogymnoascus sp. VKM F-4246]|nr:hypothetical protein V492_04745 [Pseudogymnoascus sp. VKM F-4246]
MQKRETNKAEPPQAEPLPPSPLSPFSPANDEVRSLGRRRGRDSSLTLAARPEVQQQYSQPRTQLHHLPASEWSGWQASGAPKGKLAWDGAEQEVTPAIV